MKSKKLLFHRIFFLCITIFILTIPENKNVFAQIDAGVHRDQITLIFDTSKLGSEYERQMVTDVLVDYMLLKNTLAKGKAADARFTASTIIKVIADYRRVMNPDLLSDPKRFSEEMLSLKTKFRNSASLDDVRTNFSSLTEKFIEFVKSYGLYNKTIYLYQCSETDKFGQSYWISDSNTDNRNPYGDKYSADCISLKENWIFK